MDELIPDRSQAPVVTSDPVGLREIGQSETLVADIPLTPEQQSARELLPYRVGEVLPESGAMGRVGLGALSALTFDPNEFAQILKVADPRIQVSTGPRGGVYIKHPDNPQTYVVNKPGLSWGDFTQTMSAIAAATPAGLGRTVLTRAGLEAAAQAAIELGQRSAGGEFNVGEVAMAPMFSVASDLPGVVSAGRQEARMRSQVAGTLEEEAAPEISRVAREATTGRAPQAAERMADVVQPDPRRARAVEELGLEEITPARMVSQNPQYIQVEQALAQIPGSAMANSEKQFIDQLSARAGNFIDEFGGSRDLIAVDDLIKKEMSDTMDGLRSQSDALYAKISATIDPRARITNLRPLRDALRSKAIDAGGVRNLSQPEQQLFREVQRSMSATGRAGQMTYTRLDELRQKIGEQYGSASRGMFAGDAASFQLGRLYDALTEAQDQALRDIDPAMSQVWKTAKALVAERKGLEEIAKNVAGRNMEKNIVPQLTRAMNRLSEGNSQLFKQVIEAVPESMRQEAVVTALGGLFTRGGRTNVELSPGQFAAWWNKIKRDSGARELLFQNLPAGGARYLNNLASISKAYADAAASAPKTGITNAMEMMNNDNGFISKFFGEIPIAGSWVKWALESAPEDTLKAASQMMGDPTFKRIIVRAARGEPTDRAEASFIKSKVFNNWANTVPANIRERALAVGVANYFLNSTSGEE